MKHRHALDQTALKYCSKELYNELLPQIKLHDLDKVVMLTLMDAKLASNLHRINSNHHTEQQGIPFTRLQLIEMILDWECARYTKPDKPLNAYDTMVKYYSDLEKEIMPLLSELGLNISNTPSDENILKETNEYNLSDDEIKKDIEYYIDNAIHNGLAKECIKVYKKRYL